MASPFKNRRFILASIFLVFGLIIGLGIAVRSNVISDSPASREEAPPEAVRIEASAEEAADLQGAFIDVAERVGPAVVSIATEVTQKIPARRFGPPEGFFDDHFDDFFKDFFGEIPEREFKRQGLGSGVIIDESGYILTNDHVIGGADKITAILPDGRKFEAEIKGRDERSDLAVIKIDADNLPAAKLGDSDSVKTGQWVIAIGNPFGFVVNNPNPTVTVGVVSAMHRSLPLGSREGRNYIDLIQTDAAINPGNSGGPLCDLDGNIIGINVAIYSTTGGYQGIGFAIPVNTVKWAVDDLIEGRKVLYGWLGVTVQELSGDMAEYFDIEDGKGIIIIDTIKGSPADKSGLRPRDIIRSFNGMRVKGLQDLLKYVGRANVGEKSEVGVIRDGKELKVNVTIGERPSDEAVASGGPEEETPDSTESEKWRGLSVIEITDETAEKYGIDKQEGVLAFEVEAASPAYEAGLRKGLVIKEIDKRPIRNMSDYADAVSKAGGNVLARTDKGYFIVKE